MNIKRVQFNDKQRLIYTTIGGIPHLDGNYTVFGEIVEGFDVVEKISQVQTDSNDRPVEDIKFKVRIVK
ncbi:MAG: peptidylprolyl isomerase [Bacteroidota bacterium]